MLNRKQMKRLKEKDKQILKLRRKRQRNSRKSRRMKRKKKQKDQKKWQLRRKRKPWSEMIHPLGPQKISKGIIRILTKAFLRSSKRPKKKRNNLNMISLIKMIQLNMFLRSKSKRRKMRRRMVLKTILSKGLLAKTRQSKMLLIISPRTKHRTPIKTLLIRRSQTKMRPRITKTKPNKI